MPGRIIRNIINAIEDQSLVIHLATIMMEQVEGKAMPGTIEAIGDPVAMTQKSHQILMKRDTVEGIDLWESHQMITMMENMNGQGTSKEDMGTTITIIIIVVGILKNQMGGIPKNQMGSIQRMQGRWLMGVTLEMLLTVQIHKISL